MLVHSYLTSGFVNMAEVFLLSLNYVYGNNAPLVWLDTRGLKPQAVEKLKEAYPRERIHIVNKKLPLRPWAKEAGVPPKLFKQYKRECEQKFVSNKNRAWKLKTAGDDRILALHNLMFYPRELDLPNWDAMPKFIAHFDIDTLFRKTMDDIPDLMSKADLWLKLRPENPVVKARITIDVLLIRPTDRVFKFFNDWRNWINRVPLKDRPVGYGQTSCWHAFEQNKGRLNFDTLPLTYGLPGRNKDSDFIWTGNKHNLAKADCVKLFKKELDKCKES